MERLIRPGGFGGASRCIPAAGTLRRFASRCRPRLRGRPSTRALAGILAWAALISGWASAATAAEPGADRAAPLAAPGRMGQTEWSAGVGALLVLAPLPFGHVEVRHHPAPQTSLAGFASILPLKVTLFGSSARLALVNAGVEARYHLAPGSSYDPHVGAGGGLLIGVAEGSASSGAWVWANAGVTFSLGPALRLDLEVSPALLLGRGLGAPGEGPPVLPLPFARLRWIL